MKSTAMSGVKQFLKPDAYKQSELWCQVAVIEFLGDWGLASGDGVPFV